MVNSQKTGTETWITKHSLSLLGGCGPGLRLGGDNVSASEHIHLLCVITLSDLSLKKHVSNVCAASFFQLCQLRRVRRSLDSVSAATLVHAFVSSRVDYCNAVFAGAPKTITDRLQRVLNGAARVSAKPRSLIVACHGLCIPSFIGWTFLNESTTNSVCLCTDASTTKLLGT